MWLVLKIRIFITDVFTDGLIDRFPRSTVKFYYGTASLDWKILFASYAWLHIPTPERQCIYLPHHLEHTI